MTDIRTRVTYDLTQLAQIYYEQYVYADSFISRRPDALMPIDTFDELPSSELECIKAGLQAVIKRIDPDAKCSFIPMKK